MLQHTGADRNTPHTERCAAGRRFASGYALHDAPASLHREERKR